MNSVPIALQERLPFSAVPWSNQFLLGTLAFFDYGNVRVEMYRVNFPLEVGWNTLIFADSVYAVCQSTDVSSKGVMEIMNILTQINSTRSQVRQHFLKSGNLLLRKMSAVINQNINRTNLISKVTPKGAVCLIAYEDSRLRVFIGFASRLNVDAINMASRPKILFPHVETSAAIYTYFDNVHFPAHELAEVAMIDLKVVGPLPDASARLMRIKIFAQRIRRIDEVFVRACGIRSSFCAAGPCFCINRAAD